MKILKIFGVVVGIHLFALMLIFANPGCSSSTKPTPAPIDTVAKTETSPTVTVPMSPAVTVPNVDSPVAAAPLNFNPDAPATAAPSGGGFRFAPTRPNTSAANALVVQPVTDVTPVTTYTVKSGDSLWSIASKNHLTYQELATANNLKSDAKLQPGAKLIIPGKKPGATPAAATAAMPAPSSVKTADAATAKSANGDAVKHTVKSGETLSVIAKNYGVKMGDIAAANNITNPASIRAGMVLTIPGWQTPGSKSSKSGSAKNGKSAEPAAPVFGAPAPAAEPDSPIKAAPPPALNTADVPVIKVEEAPAPKKP